MSNCICRHMYLLFNLIFFPCGVKSELPSPSLSLKVLWNIFIQFKLSLETDSVQIKDLQIIKKKKKLRKPKHTFYILPVLNLSSNIWSLLHIRFSLSNFSFRDISSNKRKRGSCIFILNTRTSMSRILFIAICNIFLFWIFKKCNP